MSTKRYDGSNWVDLTTRKRHDGSNWVDLQYIRRYDGSNWAEMLSPGVVGTVTVDVTPVTTWSIGTTSLNMQSNSTTPSIKISVSLNAVADGSNQKITGFGWVTLLNGYFKIYDSSDTLLSPTITPSTKDSYIPLTLPSGTKKFEIYSTYNINYGYVAVSLTVSGFTLKI